MKERRGRTAAAAKVAESAEAAAEAAGAGAGAGATTAEGAAAAEAAGAAEAAVAAAVANAAAASATALAALFTTEEQAVVASAWAHGDGDNNVVCSLATGAGGSSVDVLGMHFGRMRNAWLFDETVNAYMFLLQERDKRLCATTGARPSHFMNSFFFQKVSMSRVMRFQKVSSMHASTFLL